ncbi:ABC transporter permease, partial [Nocardia gipuzkoensis]
VENLLRGVAAIFSPIRPLTDHLPGTAAGSLANAMRTIKGESATPGVVDILSRPSAFIALGLYVAAFVIATIWLIRRRDMA